MPFAIPIAEHIGWVNPDETVNFKALDAHIAFVEAKIFQGVKIYENDLPLSGDMTVASIVGGKYGYDNGDTDVTSDNERYYWFGTIEVGTPGTHFTVEFDTGSSDLFLPSVFCNSCDRHTLWNPLDSSTSRYLGKDFRLEYGGEASVEGVSFTDVVSIAKLRATTQTLGAALKYSTHFGRDTFPPDGLLGMGFEQKSKFEASPLVQTLFSEGQITEPVFSFKLASLGAKLCVGGAQRELYTGEFTYTPVLSIRSWKVNLEKIEVNGETILSDIECIIDTGTALVLGDKTRIESLYKKIGGNPVQSCHAGYHYYSFQADSFPNISFTFGGVTFQIKPECLDIGRICDVGSSERVSGIAGHNYINPLNQPSWLIGAVFLQSVYTTFDLGVEGVREPRVGFATLA